MREQKHLLHSNAIACIYPHFSFIPDIDINRDATFDSEDPLEVQIKNGTVASIIVKRKDGTKIWDTSIGLL